MTKPFSHALLTGSFLLAGIVSALRAQPAVDAAALAQANSAFAVRLYQQLAPADGNLFFSPYSISSVLALASAGARGATASQLAAVLGLRAPPAELAQAYGDLAARLAAHRPDSLRLTVANSLWVQRDYPLRPAFLELAQRDYHAEAEATDFLGDPAGARTAINQWVRDATAGKITDLVPPGSLNRATRLVLCDAVYFKARWATPFERRQTAQENFFVPHAGPTLVPMMKKTTFVQLAKFPGVRIAALPYVAANVEMVVLLPTAVEGTAALGQALSPDQLQRWLQQLDQAPRQPVALALPRFEMTWRADLVGPLSALGAADAFGPRADFSGLSAQGHLSLTKVLHQSYVKADEEGTEAAAATGGVMTLAVEIRPRLLPFRVDHPFLFLIRDRATGTILFFGRVVDPR